jgi:hypothetical protein
MFFEECKLCRFLLLNTILYPVTRKHVYDGISLFWHSSLSDLIHVVAFVRNSNFNTFSQNLFHFSLSFTFNSSIPSSGRENDWKWGTGRLRVCAHDLYTFPMPNM